MEPIQADRWREAVQHLLAVRRPEQAEQVVRRHLAQNPQEAAAHELLALTLLNQPARTQEALTAAREAIALDPQQPDAHYFHSVALLRSSRVSEALRAIAEALRLGPRTPTYLGYKAVISNSAGHAQEALRAADAGLAVDPSHLECLFQRITALRNLGERREAASTIRQLAQWHPNHVATHQLLGEEALRDQQPAAAASHFREAARLRPTAEQALKLLKTALERQAETAFYQQEFHRAATFCRELLVLEPEHPTATRLLKRALLRQHWSQRPLQWLQQQPGVAPRPTWRAGIRQVLLAGPLLFAWVARGVLSYLPLLSNSSPQANGWFWAGLLWSIMILGAAATPALPRPLLWLLVLGGMSFPLRPAWQKWRRREKHWPLAAQFMFPPAGLALLNAHTTFLNSAAALESRRFLATFGVLLLLYQLSRLFRYLWPAR